MDDVPVSRFHPRREKDGASPSGAGRMHIHGYLWLGDKATFDKESLRRPPDALREPVTPEEREEFHAALETFRNEELPPIETANWLMKSAHLIKGTWEDSAQAADWLAGVLREHAPRFLSSWEADPARLSRCASFAAETLDWGGDVFVGRYVGHSMFLSVALVTCTPNRTRPDLPCPAAV